MALDTSEPRTEWLCISVEIASQQRDRNQRVCIIFGTSVALERRGGGGNEIIQNKTKLGLCFDDV